MTVSEFLLELLNQMGVHHVFGNPGTTEIPLVNACHGESRPTYVVGLSELASVTMADGYARRRRSLGVVNVHVTPGLGNSMGALYTASAAHTPLLVVVGTQDLRHRASAPVLDGPLEAMVAPIVKGVLTLCDGQQAPQVIRQAIRLALSPPQGPVALLCPLNVMEDNVVDAVSPVVVPQLSGLSNGDAQTLAQAIEQLRHPAIIAADDVYWSNADRGVQELAERIGAPIFVAPYTAVLPVDTRTPSFAGYLPPNRAMWSRVLSDYDGLIFLGGTGLRPTLFSEGSLPQTKMWIGTNPRLTGIEGEFSHVYMADISKALRVLNRFVAVRPGVRPRHTETIDLASLDPFHPTNIVDVILKSHPDVALVDESGLSTTDVRALFGGPPGMYMTNGSGGIGWAIGAMVGAMFADSSPVLGLIGDGSALYAAEALWTASHWNVTGARLFVFNNQRYATLNLALQKLTIHLRLEAFDIGGPDIRFEGIAQAFGWHYTEVLRLEDIRHILARPLTKSEPNHLIDIRVPPDMLPMTAKEHF